MRLEAVVGIRHDADRSAAGNEHHAGFARGKLDNSIFAFAGQKLRVGTGTAGHHGSLTGVEFDVVNHRTQRNIRQEQRVAHFGSSGRTRWS